MCSDRLKLTSQSVSFVVLTRDWVYVYVFESCLLGTYDAAIASLPLFDSDEGFRVISKTRERVGRKIYTDVGLFGATGEVHVLGKATWIVVSPEVAKGYGEEAAS